MHLAAHLHRQREWSERTFGPGPRAMALRSHIYKELGEITADPADPEEWIDVAILALDGALRTGATPEQVCEILRGKQAKNEVRRWPDPATADPDKAAEHLRPEAPTPHVFKVGDRVRFARETTMCHIYPRGPAPLLGAEGTITAVYPHMPTPLWVNDMPCPNDRPGWYFVPEALDLVAAA